MKRTLAGLTLADALQLVPADDFVRWSPMVDLVEPSETILENFRRFESFDLNQSEAAKLLLIDAVLAEVVPAYPQLKVWKAVPVESDLVAGVADYILSRKSAYMRKPLLCAVEAKRDDFVQGATQCIAEMVACRWNNRQEQLDIDLYGIVSNGEIWHFYRLATDASLYETGAFGLGHLPELLGVLHAVCAACADNIP